MDDDYYVPRPPSPQSDASGLTSDGDEEMTPRRTSRRVRSPSPLPHPRRDPRRAYVETEVEEDNEVSYTDEGEWVEVEPEEDEEEEEEEMEIEEEEILDVAPSEPGSEGAESDGGMPPPSIQLMRRNPSAIEAHPQRSIRAERYSNRLQQWRPTSFCAGGVREPLPPVLRVVTWNVDFASKHPKDRLSEALHHIMEDVMHCNIDQRPDPCIIMLQEVHQRAFSLLQEHSWVQRYFIIMPGGPHVWGNCPYGIVTLVSRTVPLVDSFVIDYPGSLMGRQALVAEIKLGTPAYKLRRQLVPSQMRTFRIANTHLESLPSGGPQRPEQMRMAADSLRDEDVCGGLVCGDMNAILPSDEGIPEDAGLWDAWTRDEGDEDGYTWGYQSPLQDQHFPPGRLDKVLFTDGDGFSVDVPERIGVGVRAKRTRSNMFVSDHYGLVTTLHVARAEN